MKKLILSVFLTCLGGIAVAQSPQSPYMPNQPLHYGPVTHAPVQLPSSVVVPQAAQATQAHIFGAPYYGAGQACCPICGGFGCRHGMCEGQCGPGKYCVPEVQKKKIAYNSYSCKMEWFCLPCCPSCFTGCCTQVCGVPCNAGCGLQCNTCTKRVLMKLVKTIECEQLVCVPKDCDTPVIAPKGELIPAPKK